jgi:predicted Na+-dependent transporter
MFHKMLGVPWVPKHLAAFTNVISWLVSNIMFLNIFSLVREDIDEIIDSM